MGMLHWKHPLTCKAHIMAFVLPSIGALGLDAYCVYQEVREHVPPWQYNILPDLAPRAGTCVVPDFPAPVVAVLLNSANAC
jgi:hypothetical protein